MLVDLDQFMILVGASMDKLIMLFFQVAGYNVLPDSLSG